MKSFKNFLAFVKQRRKSSFICCSSQSSFAAMQKFMFIIKVLNHLQSCFSVYYIAPFARLYKCNNYFVPFAKWQKQTIYNKHKSCGRKPIFCFYDAKVRKKKSCYLSTLKLLRSCFPLLPHALLFRSKAWGQKLRDF